MAEKYGEVPKRFTRKWWEYFWDYYKVHTIVILLILVSVIYTVHHFITAPEYEFNIAYSAESNIPQGEEELFRQKLSQFVTDSDGDGKDGVAIIQNSFISGMEDAQMERMMITRMQLEMTDEDTIVYIFSEDKLEYMIDSPEMEGAFLPVNQWLSIDVDDEKLYMCNGNACAVRLNSSKMLENYNINSDNLYIGVRNHSEELSDEMKEKIADAKRIANAIVEY